jgi:hypothetical protein
LPAPRPCAGRLSRHRGRALRAGEGLVTYIDAAWKRCLQTLTGEAICRSSARFALTHAGRALVLRAARLIEGSAA